MADVAIKSLQSVSRPGRCFANAGPLALDLNVGPRPTVTGQCQLWLFYAVFIIILSALRFIGIAYSICTLQYNKQFLAVKH